ncbi:MAG: OadG-related small transporter subunit [Clostridia bacterium]|nr:OadG-related small transporter subunit [Clostridia bacterium]
MDIFLDALKVMGIGVCGVFLVLLVFYILVKLMMRIFPVE